MTPEQRQFIAQCEVSAKMIAHPYPLAVGCEAALESNFGTSELAAKYKNLFGLKLHSHNDYGEVALPTREYLGGGWTVVKAEFESYQTLEDCFEDRLKTLMRLAPIFPHYKNALAAPDAKTYILEVSQTWATDPNRGQKVLEIYQEYSAMVPDLDGEISV